MENDAGNRGFPAPIYGQYIPDHARDRMELPSETHQ